MHFSRKSRFKPLFKQIIKLRNNIQNRKKLLNFRKKKWKITIQFYKKKIRTYKNYQKFKPLDQTKYYVTRYPSKGTGYKKRFRDKLNAQRSFRLFYGGLSYNILNNQIKKISKNKNSINSQLELLKLFETRLDTILYRSKFSDSLRSARQLVTHGKVYVNNLKIKSKSYQIKPGDIISLDPKFFKLYEVSIVKSLKWPLPPKNLLVNFNTMQIIFLSNIQQTTLSTSFLLNLRLQKLLTNHI
jgi:small subunit ribosomal protein S4